jgi:addiction module HigA family antidote
MVGRLSLGEWPGIGRQSARLPLRDGEKTLRPARNPFHSGEILFEEFLVPAEITQAAFAEKIGWSRSRLSEFIHGKRGVTADAAIDLAKALGTTSKLWMNLQATYDLDRAMARRQKVA